MSGYLAILLLAAAANVSFGCKPLKEGCFKHSGSDQYLLHSDKSEHTGEDFHSGQNVDWDDFKGYVEKAICRCEKAAAERGFPYFSLRYFGVCHGLKKLPPSRSDFCIHHSFEQCMQHHDKCVGADDAEYIYKVTLKIETATPVPALEVHRNIFCEHRGARKISCPSGKTIKITKGYYGRTSKEHCGYARFFNLRCTAKTSESKIKQACDGKQTCTLNPHNWIYGDPCKFTVKYLDVEHVCEPKPKKAIMCEHRGYRSITCPAGERIEIVNGYYGRKSRSYCGYSLFYNTRCSASTSRAKIEKSCNGKQSCRLLPSNSVFGDPCRFTVKYIDVDYRCIKAN